MSRLGITSLFAGALLALSLSAPIVAQAQFSAVQANLLSVNANPTPVLTTGEGAFTAQITADSINYQLSFANTEGVVTQAHIHLGNPWGTGGIILFLCTNLGNAPAGSTPPACPAAGDVSGMLTAADVQAVDPSLVAGDFELAKQAILGGAAYVNVHTDAHPSGEIRGQTAPRVR